MTIEQLKRRIFKRFHQYIEVWNSTLINKKSRRRKWNHDINLKSNFIFSAKKIYNLSKKQIMIIKKYIDDMLNKNNFAIWFWWKWRFMSILISWKFKLERIFFCSTTFVECLSRNCYKFVVHSFDITNFDFFYAIKFE